MSKICIPVAAKNTRELSALLKKAEKSGDMAEIRLDRLAGTVDAVKILEKAKKPVIIANKSKIEKGNWRGSESSRVDLLVKAVEAGAEYVDLGIGTDAALVGRLIGAKGKKTKIILSYHDFKKTPSLKTLKGIRDRGFAMGADIVKIATYAAAYGDNLKVLGLLETPERARKPVIAFCMGEKGKISRLLAPLCGSYIIYAALDGKHKTAPGQFTVGEYRKISSLLKT